MTGGDILFDANAFIAWMEDAEALADALRANVAPVITLFSLGELRYGMKHSARPTENLAKLDRSLQDFGLLLPDAVTADFYSDIRISLRRKGRPIPSNDVWIAALALQHGLSLLTRDDHFRQVNGLTILSW